MKEARRDQEIGSGVESRDGQEIISRDNAPLQDSRTKSMQITSLFSYDKFNKKKIDSFKKMHDLKKSYNQTLQFEQQSFSATMAALSQSQNLTLDKSVSSTPHKIKIKMKI